MVSCPWMTVALFISEERLVPLFQEEDYQQQLLMGLVCAFVTVCTRGRTTSTSVKSKIISSSAEWKLTQSSNGTKVMFPKFWISSSWYHNMILIGPDIIRHKGPTGMESWSVRVIFSTTTFFFNCFSVPPELRLNLSIILGLLYIILTFFTFYFPQKYDRSSCFSTPFCCLPFLLPHY